MASKFELSIDVNYVNSWGVVEAIRELFQNAYDESVQQPENDYFFSYDKESSCILIGNKKSVLNTETLLLGCSSKTNDKNTIGQFGEGYKLATIVLLRTGHSITFYNYGAREVWTTKLVKSRKYSGRLVPTFYVEKSHVWEKVPDNDLTIKIENITEEEYRLIVESNLRLQNLNSNDILNCSHGKILLSKEYQGKIYASGLYVTAVANYEYGYDINPENINLDRDRKTIPSFDLSWETSRMWSEHVNTDQFVNLITSESIPYDINYLSLSSISSIKNYDPITITKIRNIIGHGEIPVISQDMYDRVIAAGGKPHFVNSILYNELLPYLTDSETCAVHGPTNKERFENWIDKNKQYLPEESVEEFYELMSRI